MTGILDQFASIWYYWMFASFGLGIIGLIFLFYTQYGNPTEKKKPLKIGIILLVQGFMTWVIGFGTLAIITTRARNEVKTFLSGPMAQVTLNGLQLDKVHSLELITELQAIENIMAHHSHPVTKNEIILKSSTKDSLVLTLERDSEIDNEFWVFLRKYKSTKGEEIGRIRSEKLQILLK